MARKKHSSRHWYPIDLHIHTTASSDHQQPDTTFLDILRRAEMRGLSIIAFTDHNTVAGYRRMYEDIEQFELLEKLQRILPDEQVQLVEYRRLLDKILVLPGFEFTATFGFHILGIFSQDKPVREIEHLLLDLEIPPEQLDNGSVTVGASSDVLTAYRVIDEAGGICIAAHANSSNGVAMRGFPFGGQTKIAYTQDPHLHALEVTDLESRGGRTTAAFFSGTKPEYPRRMHCIQGSDAHRLTAETRNRKKNLGVGDRTTDVLLPEVSFEALKELFTSNDFARTRPHRYTAQPAFDFIRNAREEGPNIIQDFHESITVRGGKRYAVIADICAFANTNGGTLYLGLNADPKKPVAGISDPENAITHLEQEISKRISPPLKPALDVHNTNGKKVVRALIPQGDDPPYAVDDNKIYIRSEAETGLAVRDEIVGLVLRKQQQLPTLVQEPHVDGLEMLETAPSPQQIENEIDTSPRTGVEVVSVEERDSVSYYTMRDLRNGNVVNNVTESSARKLWHYAITQYAKMPPDLKGVNIKWQGDYGVLKRYKQRKYPRFDLIQRVNSQYRYYFGVTEDGIHGPWEKLVGQK
ncbi:MAG: putative DNA binding domain-containing protein [Chloroflexota bacterium]|nr:putative DNA binding domain-containing protein [Chloroflexota bacterium]